MDQKQEAVETLVSITKSDADYILIILAVHLAYRLTTDTDKTEAVYDRVKSAPVPQTTVPDGWKLVPVEPNDDMDDVANTAFHTELQRQAKLNGGKAYYSGGFIGKMWPAMLAAAPLPPTEDKPAPADKVTISPSTSRGAQARSLFLPL